MIGIEREEKKKRKKKKEEEKKRKKKEKKKTKKKEKKKDKKKKKKKKRACSLGLCRVSRGCKRAFSRGTTNLSPAYGSIWTSSLLPSEQEQPHTSR